MTICCNVKNEAPPSILLDGTSHPVKCFERHRGNHIVTHTSPVYTTAKAIRRCFRYLDCFDGGCWREITGDQTAGNLKGVDTLLTVAKRSEALERGKRGQYGRVRMQGKLLPATYKAVYLSSELDRNIKAEQGGCLYEQPDSQEDLWNHYQLDRNGNALSTGSIQYQIALHVMEVEDQQAITETGVRLCIFLGRNISFAIIVKVLEKSNWQKPGIGVRPSVRSSSLMALPRGKDNRVLSEMTPRALCYRPVKIPTEERGGAMEPTGE